MATAFKFDQGGRVYLVTTRHFGKNLPLNNALIQVWHGQWNDLQTVRTFFPASKDVDLAILETDERIAKRYAVAKSSEVLTTAQQVWVIGWVGPTPGPKMPANRPKLPEIPYVTIGTISAIDPTKPDSFDIHLSYQKVYNLRLAGGPIVYWSPAHRDYEILGVIKRNERDAESVSINGLPPEEVVKSGIIEGYFIDVVAETISANQHP
ncbi:MAG: hypothetical protein ABR921_12975 [Candidatus Sulfotelmatobacter sp.]|jgi:hypothetical protein